MKTHTTLHRHRHPIHWHGSMFVAVMAILLTSFKSSGEMLRALQAVPIHAAVMDSVYLRDAETGHMPVMLGSGMRRVTLSGK